MQPDSSERVWQGDLLAVTVEHWGDHEREIVEHPGAVAIVSFDTEGFLTLVRQLREATHGTLLELPAGTREPGEEALATARRELHEEREYMHVFLAEGVERGEAEPADDEELEILRLPVAEIEARLGEIEDAKTLAGLLLYLHDR